MVGKIAIAEESVSTRIKAIERVFPVKFVDFKVFPKICIFLFFSFIFLSESPLYISMNIKLVKKTLNWNTTSQYLSLRIRQLLGPFKSNLGNLRLTRQALTSSKSPKKRRTCVAWEIVLIFHKLPPYSFNRNIGCKLKLS